MTDDLPDLDSMFAGGIAHDVQDCPRCEGEHMGLIFRPFTVPNEDSHWAMCPATHEPILMAVILT